MHKFCKQEISCFTKTLKRVFFRSFYTISRCDRRWHNSMW